MAGPKPAPYYTGPNVNPGSGANPQISAGMASGLAQVGSFFLEAAKYSEDLFVKSAVRDASERGMTEGQTTALTDYGTVPTVALKKGGITADAYNKAALAAYGDRLTTMMTEKSLELRMHYKDNPGALKQAFDGWHAGVRKEIPPQFQTEFDKQAISIFAPIYLHNLSEREKADEKLRKAALAAAADASARAAFHAGATAVKAISEAPNRATVVDDEGAVTRANYDPDVKSWPKPMDIGNVLLTAPATDASPSRITAAAAATGRFNASIGQTIGRMEALGRVPGVLEGRPSEAALRRLSGDVSSYTIGYAMGLPFAEKEALLKNLLNGRLPLTVPTADGRGHVVVDGWKLLSSKTANALTTRVKELVDKEFTLNERMREREERAVTRDVDGLMKELAITGDSRTRVAIENHPGATSAQVEQARKIAQSWDVITDRPFYDEMHSMAARGVMPPVETWDASTLRRIGREDRAKLEERNAKALNYLADPRVKTALDVVKTEVGEISSSTSVLMAVKETMERDAVVARLEAKLLGAIEQASRNGAVLGRTSRSGVPGPGGETGGEVEEIIKSKGADGTEKRTLVFDPLAYVQREIARAKATAASIDEGTKAIDTEKAALDAERAKMGNRRLTDKERKEQDAKYDALRVKRQELMQRSRNAWRRYLSEE